MSEGEKKEEKVEKIPKYKLLGKSGLRVSPISIGTMTFGNKWDKLMGCSSDEDIYKIITEYKKMGGNFLDTANIYQFGQR
jgi:aryl-alcohol dehydrogenase-like predicted oxidoreductase